MKRRVLAVVIMALMTAMLAMVSCSSSEFGAQVANEKEMNITAENAAADEMVTTGTLEVGENEQVTIDSNLEEGGMKIEFISNEGFDDIEEVPDLEGVEAAYTAEVNGVESQAAMFGGGSYIVRATVTEKATGTVDILVKGFDN
jgi:hypothetical protein